MATDITPDFAELRQRLLMPATVEKAFAFSDAADTFRQLA